MFMVDWEILTPFPCYLSAISNSRLVGQCAAQFYSYLTSQGADARDVHCLGHSLGAHICGMMNNHLSQKMYKIIGIFTNSFFNWLSNFAGSVVRRHTAAPGPGSNAHWANGKHFDRQRSLGPRVWEYCFIYLLFWVAMTWVLHLQLFQDFLPFLNQPKSKATVLFAIIWFAFIFNKIIPSLTICLLFSLTIPKFSTK